jgi:hypothetical protein
MPNKRGATPTRATEVLTFPRHPWKANLLSPIQQINISDAWIEIVRKEGTESYPWDALCDACLKRQRVGGPHHSYVKENLLLTFGEKTYQVRVDSTLPHLEKSPLLLKEIQKRHKIKKSDVKARRIGARGLLLIVASIFLLSFLFRFLR